jgi:hypothetical protein
MTRDIPMRIGVKLTEDDRAALRSIMAAIDTRHRRPPSISEAVKAALSASAAVVAATGALPI